MPTTPINPPMRKTSLLLSAALLLATTCGTARAAANPVVVYTDVVSGPTTGGENNLGGYVSIFGLHFGSSLANVHVYFGTTEVAAYRYFGASNGRSDMQQITVQPGALGGASGTLPIKVTVSGVDSNTDKTFRVNPGRVLFVDNVNGNDTTAVANDITHPWRHVQTPSLGGAYGTVLPGDFIVMRGTGTTWTDLGSNNSFLRFISKGGTAPTGSAGAGPITVMAYPGENVQILNTANYGISGVDRSNTSFAAFATWITISGLHIEGDGGAGPIALQVYADYWRIVNNELTAPTATTAKAGGVNGNGGYIAVYGNSIHDIAGGQQENHGIYIDGGSDIAAGSADLAYNHIYNISGGNGIQQYNNGSNGNFYPTNNILIHHNIIHDVTDKHGINIADGSGSGFLIYNNSVYNTYYSGIRFNTTDLNNAKIYNNTFYNTNTASNPNHAAISNDWTLASNAVDIRNNIFWPHTNTKYNGGSVGMSAGLGTVTNNLWYGGSDAVPTFDSAPKTGNPSFVSAGTDFHISSAASPAVDAGSSGVSAVVTNDYDISTLRPQGSGFDIGAYEFTVAAPLTLTTPSPLPQATATANYAQTFAASGGTAPYTYSVTAGTLPSGLTLASSGALSGTPSAAGTSTFTVQVKDSVNATFSKQYQLTVNAAVGISTTTLPSGTVNVAYLQTLASTGGTTPLTWSITSGTLPSGLALSASTGALSGTPTSASSGSITFKVTDKNGASASHSFTLTISAALVLTKIVVTPSVVTVKEDSTQLFSAVALDQFGNALAVQPTFLWAVMGGGTINATGLFTATRGGTFPVSASSGAVTGTASVKVTRVPNITQPATSSASQTVVNLPVTFSVSATDPDGGAIIYLWNFGDGTTANTGSASHTYTTPGNYTVTVTLSDASGDAVTSTLSISVGAGASPTDPTTPPPPPIPMTILKLTGTASFKTSGHDKCAISGVLPALPAGLTTAGQTLVLNIGGVLATFTLDKNGHAKSANGTFALKLKSHRDPKTHKAVFQGGNGPFTATLHNGMWSAAWGLDATTSVTKASLPMTVSIQFINNTYAQNLTLTYTSKAHAAGTFKK